MQILLNDSFENSFPKQSRRLRLGVVGGGRIAKLQATAARLTNRWEIVAGAFSSNSTKVKMAAKDWMVSEDRSYSNFEEMAIKESKLEEGVDAVMVTTPNFLHYDNAKIFLENGIGVICDKPMTNQIEEAESLVTIAQKTKTPFTVSYVMSCFPMIRQAREIVGRGDIGEINQIHLEFLQDWMTSEKISQEDHVKWRLDPKKSGLTSCVGDIGTHIAHLSEFITGLKMTDVKAHFYVCGAPKKLEDTAFMFLKFNNNIPGTLIATRLAPGNRGGLRVRIFGSKGGIEWDLENSEYLKYNLFGKEDKIITRGYGSGVSKKIERLINTARGFPEGIIEAWGNLYTEFAIKVAAYLDKGTYGQISIDIPDALDGLKGVKFIHASYRSNEKNGEWQKV